MKEHILKATFEHKFFIMGDCECNNLKDPFKNVINIPDELCETMTSLIDHELGATISDIVIKPALVIQTLDLAKMYYLRQYTFDTSVLLKTEQRNGSYIAYDFVINPDTEIMKGLINKAKILSLL